MKKLTLSFLASLAFVASSFGGHEVVSKEYKAPMPEPCFKDVELQLDVFAAYYGGNDNLFGDGFGGGLGVNYFFTRNLGIAASGTLYDGDDHEIWNVDLDLVYRFPIENGICIAPYILAGGGLECDGTIIGTWNVGGGLEWRATPTFAIFGEGRFIWGAADEEVATARLGLRFVF
jgi:hypothetical protein